jgi:hypothetical protein
LEDESRQRDIYRPQVLSVAVNSVEWLYIGQLPPTVFAMSTHHETGTIPPGSSADDTVQRLLTFYLANGYTVIEQEGASAATLERGKPGSGWWTSNMAKLHASIAIETEDDCVQVAYQVDTSGQLLKDVEQAFWRRELQWARRYVEGDTDEPRDMREEEARRAKHQTNDLRSLGLWSAVGIVVAILIMGFLGFI